MGVSISIKKLGYVEKLIIYSKTLMEKLDLKAIFSDETENFRSTSEPSDKDFVTVSIRTGKNNADNVYIICDDKKIKMEYSHSKCDFDYYKHIFEPEKTTKTYYFEIEKNGMSVYYNKLGVSDDINPQWNFSIIRNFTTPEWSKGAIMYQIYVDRFYNGDKTNDVKTNEYIYLGKPSVFVEDWNARPQVDDIRNFYGGDLQGVIDKIPYLKDLGIEVIYFNPIFVSPSNHKYDIQDYDYIDPHYGKIVKDGGSTLVFEKFNNKHADMYVQRTTAKENLEASNKLFAKLIEIAHKNGIRVIIDGVFNHCGAFNKWLDKEGFYGNSGNYPVGAYKDKDSIYHNYFKWYDDNWPNNDCYDGWWGYDNHPKLNYEDSKELYNYILEVGKKWVSPPFNADGWRLDVAADLGYSEDFNHKFWKDFRKAVKSANPETIILAEHYGDASKWLQGDEWDTVMNYDAFMEPVSWFLTGMEKHSEDFKSELLCNADVFENSMKYNMAKLSYQSIYTAMNELSNHDHSRFLTRTNMNVGRLHTKGSEAADMGVNLGIMKEAVTMQITWPGSPTIYYGDEAGVTGWTDPDNRRTYPWGNENKDLIDFHKAIIKIHKNNNALRKGSVKIIYKDYGILSYGRFYKDEVIVTVINNTSEQKEITIPVKQIELKTGDILKRCIVSYENGFDTENVKYEIVAGNLKVVMPPFGSMILEKEI